MQVIFHRNCLEPRNVFDCLGDGLNLRVLSSASELKLWIETGVVRVGHCKNLGLSQTSQILPSFAYFWLSLKFRCSCEDWELASWISDWYFSGNVEIYWDNTPALCLSKSSRKFKIFCEFNPAQLSCHTGKTCGIQFTSQTCLFLYLHPQLASRDKSLVLVILSSVTWSFTWKFLIPEFQLTKIAIIQSYWIFFFFFQI